MVKKTVFALLLAYFNGIAQTNVVIYNKAINKSKDKSQINLVVLDNLEYKLVFNKVKAIMTFEPPMDIDIPSEYKRYQYLGGGNGTYFKNILTKKRIF